MQQQLFQKPIHIRCEGISRWVEEFTIKELEYVLPDIVEDIFGVTNRVGWDLLNIEYTTNAQEYDLLYKFLHPSGPVFRLCYKLLSDPYIKYKFHLSLLPQKVRQSIEDGTASPFYLDKLEVDPRSREPLHLALNPLELYMFHFMYHVVNPYMKTFPYHESKGYSSLYPRLAEEYLSVFLPCDGSTVLPELPSHYISQSPHRSIPQKPMKTSTLFRQDVLVKMLKQSPVVNTLQSAPNVGIWRSELTVQLCIDFWLSMPNVDSHWGYHNPPFLGFGQHSTLDGSCIPSQVLWAQDQLPSSEHLNVVRLLVKHLHYFANSLVEDSSAMDELKKVIIPSSQQKVYHFILQTMQHWPLDSSFKQILEIWLSYIQPWRYVDSKTRYNRPRGETSPVDSRWFLFIAENLLMYSEIFHHLIERFKMIDLASSRNAYMLFRTTKVLSQPGLRELLSQAEGSLGESEGRGFSKWVRSHLLDLEGPAFQYKSLCVADSKAEEFIRTVKKAEALAITRFDEETQKNEQTGFWEHFFNLGGINNSTINERKNVPIFLSASIKNLLNMYQISEDSIDRTASLSNRTPISSSPTSMNQMSPLQMRKRLNDLKYEGDPDLQPIRSYENAFLVRLFYHLCSWINYNYSNELISWYRRRDMIGGIVRQVLCGPQVVYHFDKRVPGVSPRVSTSLPPRLSLRILANYHLLVYIGILYLLIRLITGLSFSVFTFVFLFISLALLVVFMAIRWLLGYAPLAPNISVHDISDLRPNLSFNG